MRIVTAIVVLLIVYAVAIKACMLAMRHAGISGLVVVKTAFDNNSTSGKILGLLLWVGGRSFVSCVFAILLIQVAWHLTINAANWGRMILLIGYGIAGIAPSMRSLGRFNIEMREADNQAFVGGYDIVSFYYRLHQFVLFNTIAATLVWGLMLASE